MRITFYKDSKVYEKKYEKPVHELQVEFKDWQKKYSVFKDKTIEWQIQCFLTDGKYGTFQEDIESLAKLIYYDTRIG